MSIIGTSTLSNDIQNVLRSSGFRKVTNGQWTSPTAKVFATGNNPQTQWKVFLKDGSSKTGEGAVDLQKFLSENAL